METATPKGVTVTDPNEELAALLTDKRAFGDDLILAIKRVQATFKDEETHKALGDLLAWRFELREWRDRQVTEAV